MQKTRYGLLFPALLLSACGVGGSSDSIGVSGGGPLSGSGSISIEATDAPFDHSIVAEAVIRIKAIRMHADADAESGFHELPQEEEFVVDLIRLRNGVTQFLLEADMPAADYHQARLHVDSARLTLTNGNVYDTADSTLQLTSQATSGFKVYIDPPIRVEEGKTTKVLLDFDLTKTFKPIPANDPATATRYMLHPVLRAVSTEKTGQVRGVVDEDDGQGGTRPVDDAVVRLMPLGELDSDQSIASTSTEIDGSFALLGVEEGSFDVLVTHESGTDTSTVTVTQGSVSTTDLMLK